MTKTNHEKLEIMLKLINRGDLDDYLQTLALALNNRRHSIAYAKILRVEVGDYVWLTRDLRPRMLAGQKCRVVDRTPRGNLVVQLQRDINAKWNTHTRIRLRDTHVDRVEKALPDNVRFI